MKTGLEEWVGYKQTSDWTWRGILNGKVGQKHGRKKGLVIKKAKLVSRVSSITGSKKGRGRKSG